MKEFNKLVYRTSFALAILCTSLLVYNMVAMPIYKEQVFLERRIITTDAELVIAIGFLLIPIFNLTSLLWVLLSKRMSDLFRGGTIALGTFCIMLMLGEKAMLDEIGREYGYGLDVMGEWIALYVGLAIQLLYNGIISWQLYGSIDAQRSKTKVSSHETAHERLTNTFIDDSMPCMGVDFN